MTSADTLATDRADLLATLTEQRGFLRVTTRGLTDEQAAATPTASELSLGGLIKHVNLGERMWTDFILGGAAAVAVDPDDLPDPAQSFRMQPGETLASLLADYEETAARTDEILRTVDLDLAHSLIETPSPEPGMMWSVRRVALHIIAEISQHAGHADIIRETIDGQKTMG